LDRESGVHSEAIGESDRRQTLGADGCEKGLLLHEKAVYTSCTLSLAQGGEGLGTMWGQEKARELLSEAGFRDIEIHQAAHDFQNDYYVIRK